VRDYAILGIILGSVPICFLSPYFGTLMWYWIAYFSPHRYGWGIAYAFPVAQVVALPTLAGLALNYRKLNRHVFVRETLILLLLWIWFAITLIHAMNTPAFAGHVADARFQMERVSKVLIFTFVAILAVTSREKLRLLSMLTAFSFGVLAIKGTLFGLRTGGTSRVWGPPDSFIADNNDMALALNMSLPLLFFLAREEKNRTLRIALHVGLVCAIIAVLLTYSRGGLLGLAAVLGYIAIKSRQKVAAGVLITVGVFLAFTLAPPQWMERMSTLVSGSMDDTAKQRVITWSFGWRLAQEYPLTGGAFEAFPDEELFQRYSPEPLPGGTYRSASPHSIYFQVLGEHGFVGLGLFAMLLFGALSSLRKLRRWGRKIPTLSWMTNYSDMFTGSILAYMVSGAFLGRAYFDFFYQLVASVIIMKIIWRREVQLLLAAEEERQEMEEVEQAVPA